MPNQGFLAVLVATLLLAAAPAGAAPGGPIATLPHGRYACETSGDATGLAGIRQPAMDFRITRGSSYQTDAGAGIYLLTGERLIFSTGPFEGVRMRRIRENFLRRSNADGTDSDVRCIRRPGSH